MAAAEPIEQRRDDSRSASRRRLSETIGPFLGLIAIAALFTHFTRDLDRPFLDSYLHSKFISADNLRTIASQTVILGVVALGMTIIMLSGGIDLSVGSTVALVTVVLALAMKGTEIDLPRLGRATTTPISAVPAVFLAAGVGAICGLINGVLITSLRVVPFIITLGTFKAYRGLAKWLAGNTSVYVPQKAKSWWMERVLAIEPVPSWLVVAPGVWLLLAGSVVLAFVLNRTVFGRRVQAVGSNETTAGLCGIDVPRTKVWVYAFAGVLTGLGGYLAFLQLGQGDPTTADGLELEVIAAVVIGGGSLSGGEGTILGTLIGGLMITALSNGCVQANISDATKDIIIGSIIVVAVAVDRWRHRRASLGKA